MANAVLKTPADRGSTRRVAHACRINASRAKYGWLVSVCLILTNPKSPRNLRMTQSNAKRARIRPLLIVLALRLTRFAWVVV